MMTHRTGCQPWVDQEFHQYHLYGFSIRSQIRLTFPPRTATSSADVTFFFASREWFDDITADIAWDADGNDWYSRARCPDGSDYLRWPDLFQFVVAPDGRWVACGRLEHASSASFETYLLGIVLGYAIVKQGHEPLHATSIVLDGKAIAFMGASGMGKSTLAAAFLAAGHQLLTDDLLVVREINNAWCAFPGPPRVKLFADVACRFLPEQAGGMPANPETDKLVIPMPTRQLHHGPAPIHRLYVLDNSDEGDGRVRVCALSGHERFLALTRGTFNRRLTGQKRMRRHFMAARELSRRIPVRRLTYARDLGALDRVRATVIDDLHLDLEAAP